MLLNSISPKNILSFGDDQTPIELTRLNILIGPNGSGKTNLLECVSVLQSAPKGPSAPPADWLWKGSAEHPVSRLETVIANPNGPKNLRHWMEFTATGNRYELTDERIENEHPDPGHDKPYFYFAYQNGWPVINVKSGRRQLKREDINSELSILSQRKDPEAYPELTWLGESFGKIRIYRDWHCGRHAPPRLPQHTGNHDDFLSEDFDNLAFVLEKLGAQPAIKQQILDHLRLLSPDLTDFQVRLAGDAAQVFLLEDGLEMPVARLSDGALRFLCLLAILCHPAPPPLLCIEEPELGLQPDLMYVLADLLRDAATRTQLIVNTHSDLLVEAFLDAPECVLTFGKHNGRTVARRLDAAALEDWLDQYTLGPDEGLAD